MEKRVGRKLIVDETPNRLFLKYLAEWRDEAKKKGDRSSFTYNKAHKSLKKYPLPLQCGAEAKILENFGDKICKMLDERLAKDATENGVTSSEFLEKSRKVPASWWDKVNKEAPTASRKPAKRKRATQKENKVPCKKKEASKTEVSQKLDTVQVTGVPPQLDSDKLGSKDDFPSSVLTATNEPEFMLYPGQFDVILCVDTRETMGESRRKEMGIALDRQNVCYEQRTLHIGDFLWVAQEKPALCIGRRPKELVLDYVIERKILSDLATSIRDGRFREQKIRLKNSGISHVIYLIENMTDIENQSLPEQTLRQAIYNTQIVDNITVKYTRNSTSTVLYLDLMTKRLKRLYENCTLEAAEVSDSQNVTPGVHKLTPFAVFNETGSKHKKLTVKEMFIRQLMQIHGMSYDKASSITSVHETPSSLIQLYESLATEKERDEILSKIKFGLTERNLGVSVSRVVRKVYSS